MNAKPEQVVAGTSSVVFGLAALLASVLAFAAACYLLDALLPGGDFVQPLVQFVVLAAPLAAMWRKWRQGYARVVLADDRLVVRKSGAPDVTYGLAELGAWGNVAPAAEPFDTATDRRLPLRIVDAAGREVVTLSAGLFGRNTTELRRALRGRLPFEEDLSTDADRDALKRGPSDSRRSLALLAAFLGSMLVSVPADRLLKRLHFHEDRLEAEVLSPPVIAGGESWTTVRLQLEVEGAPSGEWAISAPTSSYVDSLAIRSLASGDEVRITRDWWPGNTLTRLLEGERGRPLTAKHIYRGEELLANGLAFDEQPLDGLMWCVFFAGLIVLIVAIVLYASTIAAPRDLHAGKR